jgi:KaiC/GvpD/RAD55 family RecA-like ATPase
MAESDVKSVLEAKAAAQQALEGHDAAIVITVDRRLNVLHNYEDFNINIGYAGSVRALSLAEIKQTLKTAAKML